MTQITEYRWKCDYCENVSPAFSEYEDKKPTGWIMQNRGIADETRESVYIIHPLHFCTPAHKEAWLKNAAELIE